MKEKIIEALKTKFSDLGFGEKAIDGVAEFLSKTVTEANQIETAISGVEPLLKAFQGDIDKRVTSLKNELDILKRKPKDPEPPKKTDPPKPDDMPEWAKALMAETTSLKNKLAEQETQKAKQLLFEKVKSKLVSDEASGGFGIPEKHLANFNLLNGISIENESEIETVAKSVKETYAKNMQDLIDSGIVSVVPKSPQFVAKEGERLAKTIAENRNTGKSDGIEGKPI